MGPINKELRDLLKAFEEYHKGEEENIGSMLLTVDADTERVVPAFMGDLSILANGFGNALSMDDRFRQIMLSFLTSYFFHNPEDLELMRKGIKESNSEKRLICKGKAAKEIFKGIEGVDNLEDDETYLIEY